jgi:DNA-directed RNA polymerase sigma subunit (sigma70/sigma32)
MTIDEAVELYGKLWTYEATRERRKLIVRGCLEGRTYRSVGEEHGVSAERVRQVWKHAGRLIDRYERGIL